MPQCGFFWETCITVILSTSSNYAANVVLCESVLAEKSGFLSAMRLINVITFTAQSPRFSFKALTSLNADPGDLTFHSIHVQLVRGDGYIAAHTTPLQFTYGYSIDPSGPGAFYLTTNFDLLASESMPGNYAVVAFVDGVAVARAPLMLRFG
jgi:hypothetical protein